MKINYYEKNGGYIAVTAESPKEFKDVLYIGRGPAKTGDHESVEEQVFSIPELKKLQPVEKTRLPDEWIEALGYEAPEIAIVEASIPEPKPQPQPRAKKPAADPDYRKRGWRPVGCPAKRKAPKISEPVAIFLTATIIFIFLSWQIMQLL